METSPYTSALGWPRYVGAGGFGVPVRVGMSSMCLGCALLCEEPFPHVLHQTLGCSNPSAPPMSLASSH